MITRTVRRLAVTAVWLHQGAWKKVLGRDSRHRAIVASVPVLSGGGRAGVAVRALGVAETALAVWAWSGRQPRRAAVAQTALVVGMNAGGLVFARRLIPRRWPTLLRTAAFVALVWSLR